MVDMVREPYELNQIKLLFGFESLWFELIRTIFGNIESKNNLRSLNNE